MMDEISESSSLEIVEPDHDIVFSSSSNIQYEDFSKDADLDYSKDEPSLSFVIEEQVKHQEEIITNQPPKRKRRQIFQKYKFAKKAKQESILESENTEDEVLKTFDEHFFKPNTGRQNEDSPIKKFTIKTKSDEEIKRSEPFRKKFSDLDKIGETQLQILQTDKKEEPTIQFSAKKKVPENELSPNFERHGQSDEKAHNFFNSSIFFQTPLQENPYDGQHHSSIFEGGVSIIEEVNNHSISKDIDEITNILDQQIFQSNIERKQNEAQQQLKVANENIHHNADEMKSSRSTVVYQNIDLSASVAPSIMIKDSRLTAQEFGQRNFLGVESNGMGRRYKTMQNLFVGEDEKINQQSCAFAKKKQQYLFEESRFPFFLRQIRKLNQIYPNFQNNNFSLILPEEENKNLQALLNKFSEALELMSKLIVCVDSSQIEKEKLLTFIEQGITIKQFLSVDWNKLKLPEIIEKIKPNDHFVPRQWNKKKAVAALQNYKQNAQYYFKIKINLKDSRGVAKYFDIRKKFWDIERNLKMISQDIYAQLTLKALPSHYFQFRQIIIQSKQNFTGKIINNQNPHILFRKVKLLQEKQDHLACSQIGMSVFQIIKAMIKFHCSF